MKGIRALLINVTCGYGSTGRIVAGIADDLVAAGYECRIGYGRGEAPEMYRDISLRIGNDWDMRWHGLMTRLFDTHGFHSKAATKRFLEWAEEYDPDFLWLHNIHGYYLNIEMLFTWIKSHPNMRVNWTLHDCWAFTGHCTHFTVARCSQWKSHCEACVQKRRYPASYFCDNCKQNFDRKRAAFSGVKDMMLITPSRWLADLVGRSFLKEYPVEVHYNAVDRNIFKPTPSDFREKHGLTDRIMVLGVASVWDNRKGLDDFSRLFAMLDSRYVIVLVGLNEQQIARLSKGILGLPRTGSAEELAAIYTAADVFVNPSREETFGMTTVEAIACGTDAIVYRGTACEEIVEQSGRGVAVHADVEALYQEIVLRFGKADA